MNSNIGWFSKLTAKMCWEAAGRINKICLKKITHENHHELPHGVPAVKLHKLAAASPNGRSY